MTPVINQPMISTTKQLVKPLLTSSQQLTDLNMETIKAVNELLFLTTQLSKRTYLSTEEANPDDIKVFDEEVNQLNIQIEKTKLQIEKTKLQIEKVKSEQAKLEEEQRKLKTRSK